MAQRELEGETLGNLTVVTDETSFPARSFSFSLNEKIGKLKNYSVECLHVGLDFVFIIAKRKSFVMQERASGLDLGWDRSFFVGEDCVGLGAIDFGVVFPLDLPFGLEPFPFPTYAGCSLCIRPSKCLGLEPKWWNSKTAHPTQSCLHLTVGRRGDCGSGHSSNINRYIALSKISSQKVFGMS